MPPVNCSFAETQPREAGRRLSVAIGLVGVDDLRGEVARMLQQTLAYLGHRSEILRDGDPAAYEYDLLLLPGRCTQFNEFAHLLSRPTPRRPITILWQSEPLPPPFHSLATERLGVQLIDPQWDDVFGWWARPLNRVLRPRGELTRALRIPLARRWNCETAKLTEWRWWNIAKQDLALFMRQAAWIRQHADPRCGWIDEVVCTKPAGVDYLRHYGIPARFIPMGYHPSWGHNLNLARDVDVLFLGSVRSSGRRSHVTDALRKLQGRGFRTKIVQKDCFGQERTELLNRTRIVINLVKYPWEFPGMRLMMSIGCGAMVVSNEAEINDPYHAEIHYAAADASSLAEVAQHYLDRESQRVEFARRALEETNRHLSMELVMARMLQPYTSRRANAA